MNYLVLGMVFALLASAAGKGGTCTSTDTPLQWTIETNYVDGTLNSVLSDNGTPYVDGQSGVTARIHICSGTNDATLNLKTRYYTVNFLKMLAANPPYTPSYAGTNQAQKYTFINIRNVLYAPTNPTTGQPYTRADEYQFTTQSHMSNSSTSVVMLNPNDQAATANNPVNASLANSPYPDSLVDVYHCPANSTDTSGLCAGVVHETWFVWPDQNPTASGTGADGGPITQVATLLVTKSNTSNDAGEFSIPFYLVIQSLQ